MNAEQIELGTPVYERAMKMIGTVARDWSPEGVANPPDPLAGGTFRLEVGDRPVGLVGPRKIGAGTKTHNRRRSTMMEKVDDRLTTMAATHCPALQIWEWEGGALRAEDGYQTLEDALRDRELADFWRNSDVDLWRHSATPAKSSSPQRSDSGGEHLQAGAGADRSVVLD